MIFVHLVMKHVYHLVIIIVIILCNVFLPEMIQVCIAWVVCCFVTLKKLLHFLDLFFAGENLNTDQPYSFTCPICGRLGFTNTTLFEHVNILHSDNSIRVVCYFCLFVDGVNVLNNVVFFRLFCLYKRSVRFVPHYRMLNRIKLPMIFLII